MHCQKQNVNFWNRINSNKSHTHIPEIQKPIPEMPFRIFLNVNVPAIHGTMLMHKFTHGFI